MFWKESRNKSSASQNFHKIISTHLLTVLTMSVILQLEQEKRSNKYFKSPNIIF